MGYFHWPAWARYLAVFPSSSCTPAHYMKMEDWKKVLDFLVTAKNISVINILLILNPNHNRYWKENLYPGEKRTGS